MSPLFYFPQNRGKNTIFPRHIRFNTEVLSCHWDESGGEWTVKTKSGKDYRANILIPALGAFRKIRVPEFKVREKIDFFPSAADGAVVSPWWRWSKLYATNKGQT